MRGAGYYFREPDYMCVVWTTDRRGAWWIDDGRSQVDGAVGLEAGCLGRRLYAASSGNSRVVTVDCRRMLLHNPIRPQPCPKTTALCPGPSRNILNQVAFLASHN